jgi:Immunity protein 42
MLVGNPDRFAIWFDAVDSWSTEQFNNGCIAYFFGGDPVWSLNSTLNTDISLLSVMKCMSEDVEDPDMYRLPVARAYEKLVKMAFPDVDSGDNESDYKHLVATGSLLDEGYRVFLVECDREAKIILCNEKSNSGVKEFILNRGEFQGVISEAVRRYDDSFEEKR